MAKFQTVYEIEAIQFLGLKDGIPAYAENAGWLQEAIVDNRLHAVGDKIFLREGDTASAGDWIVRDSEGELSVCAADTFSLHAQRTPTPWMTNKWRGWRKHLRTGEKS